MSKQWYILWNGQADKNHIGKPCMVHTPVVDTSKNEARHWAQDIASWHVMPAPKGRGWRNPGYLFVIERDGTIYYCPETSLNQCHCQHAGNNRVSFGVSLVGDGTKQSPALLRTNLSAFIMKTFHSVDGSQEYVPNWHIELIADKLTRCMRGEIKRLIINLPPRSLKSVCAGVAFPAWVLGHDPGSGLLRYPIRTISRESMREIAAL